MGLQGLSGLNGTDGDPGIQGPPGLPVSSTQMRNVPSSISRWEGLPRRNIRKRCFSKLTGGGGLISLPSDFCIMLLLEHLASQILSNKLKECANHTRIIRRGEKTGEFAFVRFFRKLRIRFRRVIDFHVKSINVKAARVVQK